MMGRRASLVAGLLGLVSALCLAGCGVVARAVGAGGVASQPVWVGDGSVYYLWTGSAEGGTQVLRQRIPDGSDRTVNIATPAEVLRDPRCPTSTVAAYTLFRWPDGDLGAQYRCGTEESYFYAYTGAPSLRLVSRLPRGGPVAWQDNGANGYVWRRGQPAPAAVADPVEYAFSLALDQPRGIVAMAGWDTTYVLDIATGRRLAVVDGVSPAFSPDGSQMIYVTRAGGISKPIDLPGGG